MKDPIIRGKIHNGKMVWTEFGLRLWNQQVAALEGQEVEVIIRKKKNKRTLDQNAWYWGCILPLMAEAFGYDSAEEVHEALKWRLLKTHEDHPMPSVRSTAKMTTKEFSEYVERVRQLSAEMGLDIPDPQRMEWRG